MICLIEYKASHKPTLPHLRLGLRPMSIYNDVVHRATKPTKEDPEALFQYHADRLVAAVVTQTFHYMIEAGFEYTYITTGETIVFLKIGWTDPITLYYHLTEPGPEVDEHPDDLIYCTAVSQVLAFTLLTLCSPARKNKHCQDIRQDDRQLVIKKLKKWKIDPEFILQSIPPSERNARPTSSVFKPKTYKAIKRSPYSLRSRCRPNDTVFSKGRSPEQSDDESKIRLPDTPTPAHGQHGWQWLAQQPRKDSSHRSSSIERGGVNRKYCTQKCLLGLVSGRRLDEQCPNSSLHRREGSDFPRRN